MEILDPRAVCIHLSEEALIMHFQSLAVDTFGFRIVPSV